MKKVFTLIASLLVSGAAVFAFSTVEPSAESSIVFLKTGSIVKVIYTSDKESLTRVSITDIKGRVVFSEMVRSKNGFSRPYNLSRLAKGQYFVRVSDGNNSSMEKISLKAESLVD